MGEVLAFPQVRHCGTVHVVYSEGRFEIAHESHSGDSWGFFASFETAGEAIDAAHRLNRVELADSAAVHIHTEALQHLYPSRGELPARRQEDF